MLISISQAPGSGIGPHTQTHTHTQATTCRGGECEGSRKKHHINCFGDGVPHNGNAGVCGNGDHASVRPPPKILKIWDHLSIRGCGRPEVRVHRGRPIFN